LLKQTPLYTLHQQANAKLVDFAGWSMPIHYGSQVQEHHTVRQSAGLFDVSHMGVLDITGAQAKDFLRYACANDVNRLKAPGHALYTCLLNAEGGIVDDLIIYWIAEDFYRVVLNASRREADFACFESLACGFDVALTMRPEFCIIAVQGPDAIAAVQSVMGEAWATRIVALKPFQLIVHEDLQIARTGYTGEHGVEMILSAEQAVELWQQLVAYDVKPCGLGARDTLRLEAGLNLYGTDMNDATTPDESNLAWTVSLHDEARDFIGKAAILSQRAQGAGHTLVGLVMDERGMLRNHQTVYVQGQPVGEITSGSFAPTLNKAIALARLPVNVVDQALTVDRRGTAMAVRVVKPPFVRFGQSKID
jgi:aminomethyltransferase